MQDGDDGQDRWEKENNPIRKWLQVQSKILDGLIVDYNNVAFAQNEDVIMAFKITQDEYFRTRRRY